MNIEYRIMNIESKIFNIPEGRNCYNNDVSTTKQSPNRDEIIDTHYFIEDCLKDKR